MQYIIRQFQSLGTALTNRNEIHDELGRGTQSGGACNYKR